MFVLVGLGNPGSQYKTTRHNAGFLLLDSIANDANISITQEKFKSILGRGTFLGQDVLLVKPQTFMNLSGDAVQQVLSYYKIPERQLIVLFDDLDIEQGQVKTRFGGGHGGHNGIRSLLQCLPSDKFYRVKIGIGRPVSKMPTTNWVLNSFSNDEFNLLNQDVFPTAKERIKNIMKEVK